MQENYENFKIFTAFSRDQDDKCYVQHVIKVRIPINLYYSKGPSLYYVRTHGWVVKKMAIFPYFMK